MQTSNGSVLIWAIDAYAEDRKVRDAAVTAINSFSQGVSLKIFPTTVIDPGYLGWPRDFAATWSETFSQMTEERLEEALKDIPLRGLEPPRILVSERHSRRVAALRLLDFAREMRADAILVTTHARRLLDRVMLGSFTETLLSLSTMPVLSVSPSVESLGKIERVFVPTDFSAGAKQAFRCAIELARPRGASLTLYHRIPNPIGAVAAAAVSMTGAAWPIYDQVLRIDESERRAAGDARAEEARSAGIPADVIFEKSATGLADAILAAAREYHASLLVNCVTSEAMRGVFHGAVVRQLLHGAHCPVWTSCLGQAAP